MALLTLSKYLGILQDDPDNQDAFNGIKQVIESGNSALLGEEPDGLMAKARKRHEAYGNLHIVARLLELEIEIQSDNSSAKASLYNELGRIYHDELLDVEPALAAYQNALNLEPDDKEASDALKHIDQASNSWRKFAKRFIEEADSATDLSLKTSLLTRAASLIWQFKRKGRVKETEKLFVKALEIDPSNTRAAQLYAETLRYRGNFDRLAQVLLDVAEHTRDKEKSIGFYLRAARVFARELDDKNRAVACYERVLDFSPGNSEGLTFLAEYFTEAKRWDHLVALYEDALRVRQPLDVEKGILLQIGMVHWQMLEKPQEAEIYFDRLRKLEQWHPVVLRFYREYLTANDDIGRLLNILADAQRMVDDRDKKLELAIEMAKTAQLSPALIERSIDAWKLVQKIDPTNYEASQILKDLYRKTEKWNALVEVTKVEIDSLPTDDVKQRVELLRDLVEIYRDYLKMDVMVINTYNSIIKLVPDDRTALTALADKYEAMGRWNDLIQILNQEAEVVEEDTLKVDLYLRIASLWVERFANYNQATGPLQKVLEFEPDNQEALSKLKDIYTKKRAWQLLYGIIQKETELASDPHVKLENTIEMAKLAGNRLHRYDEAVELWRKVLEQDSSSRVAIDTLEKLAENRKDWKTLVEVLEKRLNLLDNDEDKIKTLQRLGTLYAEQLNNKTAAADAWRRVLLIDTKNGRARRTLREMLLEAEDWNGLESLYAETQDWEALVDVLGSVADKTENSQLKIDISFRAARIYESEISEPQRAFRSYERILSVDPDNIQAAEALVPIYEREEKWSRLVGVLKVILAGLLDEEKDRKLELLCKLRLLSIEQLRDSDASFDYSIKAYQLDPENPELIANLEESAVKASAFDRVVNIYLKRLKEVSDEQSLAIRRRIADIALNKLDRSELAIEQLMSILVMIPDDQDSITTLDDIYRDKAHTDDLRSLLIHRLDYSKSAEERQDILRELAHIEEDTIADPLSAAARYREMVEIDPNDREALIALDRLAVEAERWEELADILLRRRNLEEGSVQIELDTRLGLVYADKLDNAENAVNIFEDILAIVPDHTPAIDVLEKLSAKNPNLAYSINKILETAYQKAGDYQNLNKVLQRLLGLSNDPQEIHEYRLELADISATRLDDSTAAYQVLEAAFLDRPSDTELWDKLHTVAEKAQKHQSLVASYANAIASDVLGEADKAELSTRVAQLYDEVLGEPESAEPFYRRVLAYEPLNDKSFIALKELLTGLERWEDLQTLYRERIEATIDSSIKLELLLQVCFLFEEILDSPEKAIQAYQSVLELQPDHGPAIRTLERLYQRTENWQALSSLLRRRLDQSEGQDAIELLLQLGDLYETKLDNPSDAVDQYEAVLMQQPTLLRAQEAMERLLCINDQRQRIAAILAPLYENQGAYSDLVRILEIQLEDVVNQNERAFILLRIAGLQESRLRDGAAAFRAYAQAVEADPSDVNARQELARMSETREAFRKERVEVLEKAIQASNDTIELQSDLLLEQARLLDERLNEIDAAEEVYNKLIALDSENGDIVLSASIALARIHDIKGNHAAQAQDLERQVKYETDPDVRRELLVRRAALLEDTLDDLEGAIAAHRARFEIDQDDIDAMYALERLYGRTQNWQELISVLQNREGIESDDHERRTITHRIALIYQDKLGDAENAIAVYNELVDRFGPDKDAYIALTKLYENAERWEDLLDVLQMRYDQADDQIERAELHFRAAELMRMHTMDLEKAMEIYQEVLEVIPDHEGTLAALELTMSDLESEYRKDAARIAQPRYESSLNYDKLIRVLDVLADSEDPVEKLQSLRRASEIAEHGLNDINRAFHYLGRAIRAGLSEDSLSEMLLEYQRLAAASELWMDFLTTLKDIAPDIFNTDLQPYVYRKIAEVARTQFNNVSLAREYYNLVLNELPEDIEALDALEILNAELGDYASLIQVLTRKQELSSDPGERRAILLRQATIYEQDLDDIISAIAALEDVIIDYNSDQAYQSLERLYTIKERWSDLGAMYEQQLERNAGNPVELHYRLGDIYIRHMSDQYQAIDHLRRALEEDSTYQPAIDLLESMMTEGNEYRATAAEILEPGYLARMEWSKLTSVLEARIEMEIDPEERMRLLVRLGQIYEDQLEDFIKALEVFGRLFREDIRNQDVWETMIRLAKVSENWSRLVDIFSEVLEETTVDDTVTAKLAMQIGQLCDERLNNLERAAKFYSKVLEYDQTDQIAFTSLELIYQRSSEYESLLKLYRAQTDVAESDRRRVALLHKMADVYLQSIGDKDGAIDIYREILDVEPSNNVAIEALDQLLTELEKWDDLAEHLRHRIDLHLGTSQEVTLKHRLAELLATRLDDKISAIDIYEEITHIDQSHELTISALEVLVQDIEHRLRITQILEPIYRHLDQWKKLVAIFEAQIELLDDPIDNVRLLREVAILHEQRGQDALRAFHAWTRAFILDPLDDDIRSNLDRLAAIMGAWDELITAYEKALQKTDDSTAVSLMLTTIARVHDEKRGDPRSAIQAYERLLVHEPDDPSPYDSLEALHTMVGDWRGLVNVFERRIEQVFDTQERGELLRRIGSVLEELLNDQQGAIEAYRRAVTEDDTDLTSLESLDRLYTATSEYPMLFDTLKKRIELADDPEERILLGLRLGELADEHLRNSDEAIDAFQHVLDDQSDNQEAVKALTRLYQRQAMWPELLENLKIQIGISQDESERVQLWHQAGEVLENELDDVLEAIAMYRNALEIDSTFESSIRSLLGITKLESYRIQVAEILDPLLRQQERWNELAHLIEVTSDAIADPYERRDEFKRLAEIHENGRRNPEEAFNVLCRAIAEDPADSETVDNLERLAEQLGNWSRLADVFGEQASSAPNPVDSCTLYWRLARVAEEKLKDDVRAIEAYSRIAEQAENPNEAFANLDRLYQKTEQWEYLSEVLERRLSTIDNSEERNNILIRLGEIREQRFDDGRGAFVLYQEVLETNPTDKQALIGLERLARDSELAIDAIEILDQAYRNLGEIDKIVGLYEIKVRLAETNSDRIYILKEACLMYENELHDYPKAISALRQAFELDPTDESVLDEIERLADQSDSFESLRGMVEQLSRMKSLESDYKKELNLRAAGWYRDKLNDKKSAEECFRTAIEAAPNSLDAHSQIVDLLRGEGREQDLVIELRACAEVETDSFEKKERLREAAKISDTFLNDHDTAAQCLQSLLELDDSDIEALDDLIRIFSLKKKWQEVVNLFARRIDFESDPKIRLELRYKVAEIYSSSLSDAEKAIAVYIDLLDENPDQARALDSLQTLYQDRERWEDLRELLERRLERSETSEERIHVRVGLAKLAEQQFDERFKAIDQLNEILLEDPKNNDALNELERLYTVDERWTELVDLLEKRADISESNGETEKEVEILLRSADVSIQKLQDSATAIGTYTRVLDRNPDHEEALRNIISLYEHAGDWENVVHSMERLLNLVEVKEAVTLAYRIAELASERLDDSEKTEAILQQALSYNESIEETRDLLKKHYEKHEQYQKLIDILEIEEASASDSVHKGALLRRMADIYFQNLQNPANAAKCLESAVELIPDDRSVLLPLCDFYIAANRSSDAIPVLERIIESYGGRRAKEVAAYHHRLGQALQGLGENDRALEHFDAAFKIDLTNIPILRDLGLLCLQKGDLDRAQKTFRALLLQKLGPDSGIRKADVYFYLGEIASKLGEKTKAKSMLERAISEAGEHQRAQELLDTL